MPGCGERKAAGLADSPGATAVADLKIGHYILKRKAPTRVAAATSS
jgi:hypothetical protein